MSKYIIDANVILLTDVSKIPTDQLKCAKKCVHFLQNFINDPDASIVLDAEGRVIKEYRRAFELNRDPNMASEFCKWVYQHMPKNPEDFLCLREKNENEFESYPDSEKLKEFDPPDRTYIALAYNHCERPPIVEASDSKWWGIKDELKKHAIDIRFIDEDYIKEKYMQKIGV